MPYEMSLSSAFDGKRRFRAYALMNRLAAIKALISFRAGKWQACVHVVAARAKGLECVYEVLLSCSCGVH